MFCTYLLYLSQDYKHKQWTTKERSLILTLKRECQVIRIGKMTDDDLITIFVKFILFLKKKKNQDLSHLVYKIFTFQLKRKTCLNTIWFLLVFSEEKRKERKKFSLTREHQISKAKWQINAIFFFLIMQT